MNPLPNDRMLEEELLGYFLTGWAQPLSVIDDLTLELFDSSIHRAIARAIIEAHQAHGRVTIENVGNALADHGWLTPIGGVHALEQLAHDCPAISRGRWLIEELSTLAHRRARIAELETELAELQSEVA